MIETLTQLGLSTAVLVGRTVMGWLENAVKDGKITKFELKQLGITVLRVGTLAVISYFGLNGVGVDTSPFVATALAGVVDLTGLTKKK